MKYAIFLFPLLLTSMTISGQPSESTVPSTKLSSVNYDSIRIILEKVYDIDQGMRQFLEDSIGRDSPGFLKYVSMLAGYDLKNQNIVIPVLERYGWLPKSKIGNKAGDAIFYVIQHSNYKLMVKYFPQLDSLAKTGEADKTHAAMMEDRLLMWKGCKQIYGTQATTSLRKDKSLVIWPIEKPEKVDSMRRALGFEKSVEENAKRLGAIYDPDEKLPGNQY